MAYYNDNFSFLWDPKEAVKRSVEQIGASACGATAVINALSALNLWDNSGFSADDANTAVGTLLRVENAGIVEYLKSRGCAGATHIDLVKGINILMRGIVKAEFYSFHKIVADHGNFFDWCYSMIKGGSALILTMNLQNIDPSSDEAWIADAWHHQMVFGADIEQRRLFMTNPLSAMTESELNIVLDSESTLMVRSIDIIKRLDATINIDVTAGSLNDISSSWRELGVGSSFISLVREYHEDDKPRYLIIPAEYRTGATVVTKL
jgi:hypothetical protein